MLTKDRLDTLATLFVDPLTSFGSEFLATLLVPDRSNEKLCLSVSQLCICFAPLPSVGKRLLRAVAVDLPIRLKHRFELLKVACISVDVLSNDDLSVTLDYRLTVVSLDPPITRLDCLTFRISRFCFLVVRKVHLFRRCRLPASFFRPVSSSSRFRSRIILACSSLSCCSSVLSCSLASRNGLNQSSCYRSSSEKSSITPIFWTVFPVFLSVDLSCFIEDDLDHFLYSVTRAIGLKVSVTLDGQRVQGDFTKIYEACLPAEMKNFLEDVFEFFMMVFAEVADGAEIWLLIGGKYRKATSRSSNRYSLCKLLTPIE